jgi:MSHA biogenesis protein MshE
MTGYRGRVGIYELLEIDAEIAAAIRSNDLAGLERLVLRAPGFVPLVERALEYVLDGTTSVGEVMTSLAGLEEPALRENLLADVLSSDATGAHAATGVQPAVAARSKS